MPVKADINSSSGYLQFSVAAVSVYGKSSGKGQLLLRPCYRKIYRVASISTPRHRCASARHIAERYRNRTARYRNIRNHIPAAGRAAAKAGQVLTMSMTVQTQV